MSDGTKRSDVHVGQQVEVVKKNDQRTGVLTAGIVKRLLTKSANHPHGIKVELENGEVGRVKNILVLDRARNRTTSAMSLGINPQAKSEKG
ncbi:MAG: YwbE family protein [Candidatus Parabeggiatoa sp. nov. 1]|nr:MAG: YwbE family protein [Gammaproteobacteria bacterium]